MVSESRANFACPEVEGAGECGGSQAVLGGRTRDLQSVTLGFGDLPDFLTVKKMAIVPEQTENRLPMGSSSSTSGFISRRIESWT